MDIVREQERVDKIESGENTKAGFVGGLIGAAAALPVSLFVGSLDSAGYKEETFFAFVACWVFAVCYRNVRDAFPKQQDRVRPILTLAY